MGTSPDGHGGSREGRSPIRFAVFGLVVALVASVLGVRLFMLQVAQSNRFASLAEANRSVDQPVAATRGEIRDRNGVLVARNVAAYAVKVRPADLTEDRRADVVARLAGLLGMDIATINVAIDSPGSRFDLVRVASDVDENIAKFIAEFRADLPGVDVVVESRRQYEMGPLLAQILGYTAPIRSEERRVGKECRL